jgi:hypothetical protein
MLRTIRFEGAGTRSGTAGLAVLLLLLLAARPASATPPDRISLTFDKATDTLAISVHHPTFYAQLHHVAKIAVSLNDSLIITQLFSTQTNSQYQDTRCMIPGTKPGDRLKVTAVCSLFGTKTVTFVVPPDSGAKRSAR